MQMSFFYLSCIHGNFDVQSCPDGLLFNEKAGVCDFKKNVKCKNKGGQGGGGGSKPGGGGGSKPGGGGGQGGGGGGGAGGVYPQAPGWPGGIPGPGQQPAHPGIPSPGG